MILFNCGLKLEFYFIILFDVFCASFVPKEEKLHKRLSVSPKIMKICVNWTVKERLSEVNMASF